MIYVKFNYKAAWFYYGPWKDISVHYNCPRADQLDGPTVFTIERGDKNKKEEKIEVIVDEIFLQGEESESGAKHSGYTIVSGWEEGQYKAIALSGCSAYLLTPEGKTLDRI